MSHEKFIQLLESFETEVGGNPEDWQASKCALIEYVIELQERLDEVEGELKTWYI